MKKLSNLMFMILSAAMLVVFAIITLFCGVHYKWLSLSAFWTIWLMTVIPIAIAIITTMMIVLKNRTTELFVFTPMFFSSLIFEVVSLIIGTVLTILFSSFKGHITWYMWGIELIVIVIYTVVFSYFVLGTKYISDNRQTIKKKVFYIKNIVSELDVAKLYVTDEKFKHAIEKLKDDIRYSDPMSGDYVRDIEEEICETIDGIIARINEGADFESCRIQIQKAEALIMQRNETIKSSK